MKMSLPIEGLVKENLQDKRGYIQVDECGETTKSKNKDVLKEPVANSSAKENTPKSRRYYHRNEHSLNNYNKKQILAYFDEHGCSEKSFDEAIKSFKINKKSAQDFFNSHIENTEKHVHDECDSLCFQNNNKWLELYKNLKVNDLCRYEQAAIITAIEENEKFPPPEELAGINLKECYGFLRRALYGLPQPEPDPKTASFLAREFELLIDAANEDTADEEVLKIKTQICALNEIKEKSKFSSLDPLNLDNY